METPLTLTREQVRRVDALAVERYGISGLVLMENAGRGVVDVLLATDSMPRGNVAILCGKGNNAGDGFVIARHLAIRGVGAQVFLLYPPTSLSGDALANYNILLHADMPIIEAFNGPGRAELEDADFSWIIDAMLGTGAAGEPHEPVAGAIDWMNAQAARRLAVDIPSGLDCDTGQPAKDTVRAEVTCTFVAMKAGFLAPQAAPYLGAVHVVSIGVPNRVLREAAAS